MIFAAIEYISYVHSLRVLRSHDLDDFNLLKFIVTSELRLKLLFSLYDSSKTIKELESEFNRKPGNISRGLNELIHF